MIRGRKERRSSTGFTLVELMVVVMIIGILAFIGVPQYMKTVETSKAQDAVAVVNMIAQANRMYALNNQGTYTSGQINGTHPLVTGNYVSQQDWTNLPYGYNALADGVNAANCQRQNGSSSYSSWGYTVSLTGVITPASGAPPPPH